MLSRGRNGLSRAFHGYLRLLLFLVTFVVICETIFLILTHHLQTYAACNQGCERFRVPGYSWKRIPGIAVGDDIHEGSSMFVYSAAFEIYRGENIFRVIAIVPANGEKIPGLVTCVLRDIYGELLDKVIGVPMLTAETLNKRYIYGPGFVICYVSRNKPSTINKALYTPEDVGFIEIEPFFFNSKPNMVPAHRKAVVRVIEPNKTSPGHAFGLCVQPSFLFDDPLQFLEWIEYYRTIGVSHFTFYNISMGPKVSCIMQADYYKRLNVTLRTMNWTLPTELYKDRLIHVNAQISQENDCMLRYRGVANYVLGVDYDEFIFPQYSRSKGISDPQKVTEPGVHYLVEGKGVQAYVDSSIAYVRHIRSPDEIHGSNCTGPLSHISKIYAIRFFPKFERSYEYFTKTHQCFSKR